MGNAIAHLPTLIKLSFQEWSEDKASRLAAALAYYTIFSLAPLLVLVIAITSFFWQKDVVRTQIMQQVQGLVGAQGAGFISSIVSHKGSPGQGIFATIIGAVTLLLGALGVFGALHDSLNAIWDVQEEKAKNFWQSIKRLVVDRLLSLTMVLGIGFLLLVSLVISAALSALQGTLAPMLPFPGVVLQILNILISLAVITVLIAMIFKLLPDAKIAWRDVWFGAFATALLFTVGRTVIGLYLGHSRVASSYGAAGSLIIVLLWIYYSAQILFFGAELTQVYANRFGSRILPEAGATVAGSAPGASQRPAGMRPRQTRPEAGAMAVDLDSPRVQRQNRQTARVLGGMMLASFLSGLAATFFTVRRRR